MVETSVVHEEKSLVYLLYIEVGLLLLAVLFGIFLEYWGWGSKLFSCMWSGYEREQSSLINKELVCCKCKGIEGAQSPNDTAVDEELTANVDLQGLLQEYDSFHADWVAKLKPCNKLEN